MSSGIRASLEIRGTDVMPPNTWMAVAPSVDVDEAPNRTIFALLAGYPSALHLAPILQLRGLPVDATGPVREQFSSWGDSTFEPSWVTYQELVGMVEYATKTLEDIALHRGAPFEDLLRHQRGVSLDAVIAFLGVYSARGYEARMVFWFTQV